MTRKLLSGVLAFAMVFGCTAPVALAEDTVVEEVEQYAHYTPSLSASSVTLAKKGDTATVTVNDVAANATVTLKNAGKNFSATLKDRQLTITAEKDVAAEETELEVVFASESLDQYGQPVTDVYMGTVKLTVKKGTVTTDEITILGGSINMPEKIAVGDSYEVTLLGKNGDKKGAPAVEAILNDVAKKFYTVATKNYVDPADGKVAGTTIVVTATKAMSAEDMKDMFADANVPLIRVTATYGTKTEGPTTVPLQMMVVSSIKAPVSISLSANPATIAVSGTTYLAAKVFMDDGFGGTYVDDYADVNWYINGVKMTGETYNDGLGQPAATLIIKKEDGEKVTAATFTASKPGTYKITVETADGNCIANKTITVNSDVGPKDSAQPWIYTTDITKTDLAVTRATKVGGTVDLTDVKFAIWGDDDERYPVTAVGGVATLKVASVTAGGTTYGDTIAAKIATIKDGVVTIANETNSTMAELLKLAGNTDITVSITGSVKFTGETVARGMWTDNSITIKVTKSSDKVAKVVYTIGDKTISNAAGDTLSMPVMTVGKTVDVDATLYDANDFSDGVNQGIIWEIQNTDPADKNVYATVDANGVVTPVAKCTGKAELVAVPVADTTKVAKGTLYIMEDPTATVAPTTAPTAAPTQAPETKTGTVNTSSSALNIRAAASTTAGVVTKAAKGSTVTILGEENGFYKVKLADGTVGYASKAYIKVVTDTPVVTITATTTANLKLRTSAPSGSVITVMPKGATVKVIEGGQSWAKVEYNGKVGYASNNYLTFNTVG